MQTQSVAYNLHVNLKWLVKLFQYKKDSIKGCHIETAQFIGPKIK